MTHLVRGVIAASTLGGVDPEIGIGVDQDGPAAGQRGQVPVHHEAGVEDDDLVAGIDHAADRQQAARPRCPAVTRTWRSAW